MTGFAQDTITMQLSPNGTWAQQMTPPMQMPLGGYHLQISFPNAQSDGASPGRGLIIALTDDEYLLLAAQCTIRWYARPEDPRQAEFVTVEEGTYLDGQWQPGRRLNGDEAWGEFLTFGDQLAFRRVVLHSYR
jgi:hypothetical protein